MLKTDRSHLKVLFPKLPQINVYDAEKVNHDAHYLSLRLIANNQK